MRFLSLHTVAGKNTNFRRLLFTLEALAELGPELTAERPFAETAEAMLGLVLEASGAQEGVLFHFSERPAVLTSLASRGFPPKGLVPLLPKQVHALGQARVPQSLNAMNASEFLSSNGNIAPERVRCIAALKIRSKLVGALALGAREGNAAYEAEDLEALGMLSHYVALAVQNHNLKTTLEQRVAENLRLLDSIHSFQDHALATFASAIDVKDPYMGGHSVRVGRYSAGIAETLGFTAEEVAGMRAAGYLHDIGKVAVDKHIFHKPTALEPREYQEMADHTVVGHRIVEGVEFPWKAIPEVVRSHHERTDGSGYPDKKLNDEVSMAVRIAAVADTFDAMTSPRPYRAQISVGEVASQLVRATPEKMDPDAVQGLLLNLRRDAVSGLAVPNFGPPQTAAFLDQQVICNISPGDVDSLAAILNHKLTRGRVYSA